jgi:signal transduction histidine kinase
MSFRSWFRPPRHVLTVFLVVAVVSAGALVWLAKVLLEQDQTVAKDQRRNQLDQAADRAVAVMQASLADLELQIAAREGQRNSSPPAGVAILKVDRGRITVWPEGGLLYYPEVHGLAEAPTEPFAKGEQAEFAHKDRVTAARVYSMLTAKQDPAVRAAALVRLAAVDRKIGNAAAAIDAYDRLSQISNVAVGGLPTGLIAREGRASVLEEAHRGAELQREAIELREDLLHGRWPLTKSQYQSRLQEADKWLGNANAEEEYPTDATSEAAAWLWENSRPTGPVTRRLIETGGAPMLVIWTGISDDTFNAAIADPTYLGNLCRDAVPDKELRCALSDTTDGRVLIGDPPPEHMAVLRTATKLPWGLHVFPASRKAALAASPQRPFLVSIFGVLIVVWSSGAYFIVRAISREMRVARLQSDFVAAVSHEFRSPLSSLRQISEMLKENRLPSEALRQESYGILARESERLHRLVEDLLDFGRFDAGAAVYHFAPLEIRGFLQALTAEFQDRVAASGYRVELNLPNADAYVRADAEALSLAVLNLLDNAVKYSPECRTIWVEAEADQRRVSIAVSDRGLGIPIHEQRDIFEKFVRGAESKALRIKGTGIGLSMVRHIMQAHGGEIRVISKPGEGSQFTMLLHAIGGAS